MTLAKLLGPWIPQPPHAAFGMSLVASFCTMVLVATPDSRSAWLTEPDWVKTVCYYLDPLLLHAVSAVACLVLVLAYWLPALSVTQAVRHRPRVFAAAVGAVAGCLLGSEALVFCLKPAFHYDRPATFQHDSIILSALFPNPARPGTSCPSGFVFRQVILLNLGLVFATSSREGGRDQPGAEPHDFRRGGALAVVAVCTVLAAVCRVGEGSHTLFDVAISVGTGGFLFWYGFFIVARIADRAEPAVASGLFTASLVYLPLFFFYSADAEIWSFGSMILLVLLVVIQRWAPQTPTAKEALRVD